MNDVRGVWASARGKVNIHKSMQRRSFRTATAVLTAACTVMAAAPGSFATSYYFATGGTGAGDGSQANPFTSISSLNNLTLGAGDNVYLHGGDSFSGSVYLGPDDQGTSSAPITLSTYGTGQATINSSGSDGVKLYDNGGFSISNLNLVGNGYTSNLSSGINVYNDTTAQQNYLRFNNINVSGYGASGLQMGGQTLGYNDVRITNVAAHDNGQAGIQTYGATFNTTTKNYANSNVYIGHSSAYNNLGQSADQKPSGNGIVLSSVNNGTMERNVVYNNGTNNTYTSGAVGIFTYNANNVTVQYNESYSNHSVKTDGDGYDLDINTTNSFMQYNYSHDNDGAGLLVYSTSSNPTTGNTVRYNISENDARKFALAGILVSGSSVNGVQVYNNTVYFDKATGNASGEAAGVKNLGGSPTGVSFRNNIFVTKNGGVTFQAAGDTNVQGNDYWAIGQASAMIIDANVSANGTVTLAAFRGDGSNDKEVYKGVATGYNVDPGLAAAGAGGTIGDPDQLSTLLAYKLVQGSALINAGLDLNALFGSTVGPQDYFGVLIPQNGAFDIGASEYVPEPAMLSALGLGSLAILARRRRA